MHVRLFGDRIFNTATFILALAILALLVGLDGCADSRQLSRDSRVRAPFLRQHRLGSRQRSIRRAAIYLRDRRFLVHRAGDRGAAEPRRRAMPERDGARLAQPSPWLPGRVAGRDSRASCTACGPCSCWVRGFATTSSRRSAHYFGWLPFFQGPKVAVGMLSAGVILAIMIIPYISSVCTDVFRVVPHTQREAALALGATKWEMVQDGGDAVRHDRRDRRDHPGLGPRAGRDDRGRDGNRQLGRRSPPRCSSRRRRWRV